MNRQQTPTKCVLALCVAAMHSLHAPLYLCMPLTTAKRSFLREIPTAKVH